MSNQISVSRAGGIQKSVYYYRFRKDDSDVIETVSELVKQKPKLDFPYHFNQQRNLGKTWNRKRAMQVHNLKNHNLRRKNKGRLPQLTGGTLE